jgi:hypothetical protein
LRILRSTSPVSFFSLKRLRAMAFLLWAGC